jgi:YegS/Rv2252/BmrU family lipid kinase
MYEENFRALVVANPQSANGALGRRWPLLREVILANFGPFEHRFTTGVGDAARLTQQALADDYEMVVAMGGDGTISEVVDGFFTQAGRPLKPEAVLGVLPFGTGGDFRKTIDASTELAEGARHLRGQDTRSIDVGRLTYQTPQDTQRVRHFINIASFGISGLVDHFVNTTTKVFGGTVSFALATVRAMHKYRPQQASLRLDDRPPEEVTLHNVAVANGRYFGGGMQIAPHAQLDDGLFDVVTLGPMTWLDLLLRGHRVYSGTHLELPKVRADRARRVEAEPVDPDEAILLDVDGETPGKLPAIFEVVPGALRLKRR